MGDKKVDESWKQNVDKEKETGVDPGEEPAYPEPNFPFFITSIGMQALTLLGELRDPNAPAETSQEPDLAQAHYLIGSLEMLSEKTRGNLSTQEDTMLKNLLYDLRLKFVEKSKEL